MEIFIYEKKKKNGVMQQIKLEELQNYLKKEDEYYIWIDTHFKENDYKTLLKDLEIHPHLVELASQLNIHPHIQISKQRLFSIFYLPYFEKSELFLEEVNFILTPNILITIQKEPNKLLNQIFTRIKKHSYLEEGPDNLMGHIIDNFCAQYYPVLERIEEKIEKLEENQTTDKKAIFLGKIKKLQSLIIRVKRYTVNQLTILEQIIGQNIIFINNKDALENATHKMETIFNSLDSLDNTVNTIFNTYLNVISTNMNEVMKVLTIIATIFLPLSFLTSWYGMNFYMPETHFRFGYLIFIGIVTCIVALMLYIFKRNKWI